MLRIPSEQPCSSLTQSQPATAASLVLSLVSHGLDTRDAIKTWKGDEDKGGKKGKKGKKEVGRTEHTLPCWL